MNEKSIYIKNGQRLSDVYSIIEPNTILCKFLTGIGATHLEITAPRHSILIEPNIPPIKGKCANPQYKSYNLFGVIQKVSIDDVSNYLDKTLRSKKYIKILTTPESFSKVKAAFEDCGIDLYSTCFLLMDECHKFIQDVDYRENITLPVDDFFCFNNKAFVSATPIIPSDPRFDEQRFTFVKVMPNYIKGRPLTEVYHFPDKATEELYKDMTTTVGIPLTGLNHEKLKVTQVYTNNVLEAVKKWIKIKEDNDEANATSHPFCFFINSTNIIHQLIVKLEIQDRSTVFCAEKSVKKLQESGFKNAFEDWSIEHINTYMFFTSRFFTALDIEMDVAPHLVFVSAPLIANSTMIDPVTDVRQAIGRFRNSIADAAHIANVSKDAFPDRNIDEIKEYITAMRGAYDTINTLYKDATNEIVKEAYKSALNALPYNRFIRNGQKDYFAIDNYIHQEIVRSCYHSQANLSDRYAAAGCFETCWTEKFYFQYNDSERLSLHQEGKSKRRIRMEIVAILDKLSKEEDSEAKKSQLAELRQKDAFIVDAYTLIGKEEIEQCKYYPKRIREAIILRKKNGTEVVQLIKNTFVVNQRYTLKYIKNELNRIYKDLNIQGEKRVTAQTIKDYFIVDDKVKLNKQKAMLIIAAKV
ncbi:hypothetical protein QVO32_01850 [Bacteroides gallinaceum]|uniref:hypothetical protein n=1 Tax=Bacteroides gallinaceum TaxID=1462571 RepID=UPI0025AB25B7|nr:hypothetical protein [Bacteroides gallinaceum]MDN0078165.1 hypothetical protein [Bacteroides gallinaceum]